MPTLDTDDLRTLLTPEQPCSVCGAATPFFAVCRRCKTIMARCLEHGGARPGLDEAAAMHHLTCHRK